MKIHPCAMPGTWLWKTKSVHITGCVSVWACNRPFWLAGVRLDKLDFVRSARQWKRSCTWQLTNCVSQQALKDKWRGDGQCVWSPPAPPCRISLGHTITSMCIPEACKLLPSERASMGKQAEGRSEKLLLTVYLRGWFVCCAGGNKQRPCLCAAA